MTGVKIWSDSFLDYTGEKALAGMEELLIDLLINQGKDYVKIDNKMGPNGIGKGTLDETLKIVAQQVSEDEYIIRDKVLSQFLESISNEAKSTIATGTNGIFNPLNNPDYQSYQKLGKAAAIPVIAGELLNDNFTNLMVLIEMVRAAAHGKNILTVDTWPRSEGQKEYVEGRLKDKLAHRGIKLQTSIVHVEAVDAEVAKLMQENPDITKKAYKKLGEKLKPIQQDAESIYPGLTTINRENLSSEQKDQILKTIETMLTEKLSKIDERDDNQEENFKKIYESLIKARTTPIKRSVSRGLVPNGRADDRNLAVILKRLISHDLSSAPAAMDMRAPVIPGGGTPEEAIEALLYAQIRNINPEYNFESDAFKRLLGIAKRENYKKVYGFYRAEQAA